MTAKKSFTKNPAEAFINPIKEDVRACALGNEEKEHNEVKYAYTITPIKAEAKTKRVQLLIKPSLYEHIKEQADAEGRSFNDFVHRLLAKGMEEYL